MINKEFKSSIKILILKRLIIIHIRGAKTLQVPPNCA